MSKILVMLAEGFEEVEAITVIDYLRRTGVEAEIISTEKELYVEGAHGIRVAADKLLNQIKDLSGYRGVVIPGGRPGAMSLRENDRVIQIVQELYTSGKLVAAICAGPIVLERAGVLKGKAATCYPGFDKEMKDILMKEELVVKDGNIITSRGPATAVYFALKLVEYLQGEDKMIELKRAILHDLIDYSN